MPEPPVRVRDTTDEYRMLELERDVRELQRGVAPVPVHEQRLKTLESGVANLAAVVERLTLAIIAGTITITASCIGVIITLASS